MSRHLSDMTDKDFVIEMLTLQYIQGKATGSAPEYVKLYEQTKEEIKAAYKETETHFSYSMT